MLYQLNKVLAYNYWTNFELEKMQTICDIYCDLNHPAIYREIMIGLTESNVSMTTKVICFSVILPFWQFLGALSNSLLSQNHIN